ncbi:MAG TPA: magnesium transporter CorA family protein [Gemmatimonadaceae bacterium]|nr:magnesium transporter CorA family protein [Gemmatimonadaceae bacterium]
MSGDLPPVPRRAPGMACSVYVAPDGAMRRDLTPEEIAGALREGTGHLWIDIDTSVPSQDALLDSVCPFHPLAVEDARNPNSRVKVEEFDGYLFVIVRVLGFVEETADPYDLRTENLAFFLGKNYLVTAHTDGAPAVGVVEEQLRRNPELLSRGTERLMHAIMDTAIDAYFPILDRLDEFTHEIEERVFTSASAGALRDVFAVRRLVLQLRRHLAPQRDVFNVLTNRPSVLLTPDAQVYFRDIYDHMLRINDSLDTYRELLSGTMDAYLTQVSNRLGVATKGLTLVATLSIPFVVVSGMWGMNLSDIPLHGSPHGFWIMAVVQVVIAVVLVAVLRWRGWL